MVWVSCVEELLETLTVANVADHTCQPRPCRQAAHGCRPERPCNARSTRRRMDCLNDLKAMNLFQIAGRRSPLLSGFVDDVAKPKP